MSIGLRARPPMRNMKCVLMEGCRAKQVKPLQGKQAMPSTSRAILIRVVLSIFRAPVLPLGFPLLIGLPMPGYSQEQMSAQQGGVSTGGIHEPVHDAEHRPITAGGFVEQGPVVFE